MLYWQLFWSFIKYSFHFVSKYSLPYPWFPLRHGTRIRVVISALMRCFPQPVGPVSCFNQMYSSQGISRIVNIKLIQNVSQKNTKGRNNLGSFLHENSMKWLLDLFVLSTDIKEPMPILWLILHFYIRRLSLAHYFVKGFLLWNSFLCPYSANQPDQHFTQTNWFLITIVSSCISSYSSLPAPLLVTNILNKLLQHL